MILSPAYWLFKSEPETYSFQQLLKDKTTHWNGVRNFQARNFLKKCEVGDRTLIYHSGSERAVVGIAEIIKAPYPDVDPLKPGDWVQVDIRPIQALEKPISLTQIKSLPNLKNILLIKQSRLSVMPLSPQEYRILTHE